MDERSKKVDISDRSKDEIRLLEAQEQEKRLTGRLERVEILNGYILTTCKEKWTGSESKVAVFTD